MNGENDSVVDLNRQKTKKKLPRSADQRLELLGQTTVLQRMRAEYLILEKRRVEAHKEVQPSAIKVSQAPVLKICTAQLNAIRRNDIPLLCNFIGNLFGGEMPYSQLVTEISSPTFQRALRQSFIFNFITLEIGSRTQITGQYDVFYTGGGRCVDMTDVSTFSLHDDFSPNPYSFKALR